MVPNTESIDDAVSINDLVNIKQSNEWYSLKLNDINAQAYWLRCRNHIKDKIPKVVKFTVARVILISWCSLLVSLKDLD